MTQIEELADLDPQVNSMNFVPIALAALTNMQANQMLTQQIASTHHNITQHSCDNDECSLEPKEENYIPKHAYKEDLEKEMVSM